MTGWISASCCFDPFIWMLQMKLRLVLTGYHGVIQSFNSHENAADAEVILYVSGFILLVLFISGLLDLAYDTFVFRVLHMSASIWLWVLLLYTQMEIRENSKVHTEANLSSSMFFVFTLIKPKSFFIAEKLYKTATRRVLDLFCEKIS